MCGDDQKQSRGDFLPPDNGKLRARPGAIILPGAKLVLVPALDRLVVREGPFGQLLSTLLIFHVGRRQEVNFVLAPH